MANSNSLRKIWIHHIKFKFACGNFKFTIANSNSLGKFKFTKANSNSLWENLNSSHQIQIHHSKFKFNRPIQFHHVKFKFKFMTANSVSQECRHGLQGKGGQGTARVSLRPHPFSINCKIFTLTFALSGNEFKDFSAWTPLIHFVIQKTLAFFWEFISGGGGGQNLFLRKFFVMLLFSDQITDKDRSFQGGKCLRGAAPCLPLVEESQGSGLEFAQDGKFKLFLLAGWCSIATESCLEFRFFNIFKMTRQMFLKLSRILESAMAGVGKQHKICKFQFTTLLCTRW